MGISGQTVYAHRGHVGTFVRVRRTLHREKVPGKQKRIRNGLCTPGTDTSEHLSVWDGQIIPGKFATDNTGLLNVRHGKTRKNVCPCITESPLLTKSDCLMCVMERHGRMLVRVRRTLHSRKVHRRQYRIGYCVLGEDMV